MNTYPYTCPNSKEPETTIKGVIEVLSHTVSYPEDNQQSTNKNMCNGENSDPRDHWPRYFHIEAKTFPYSGNPIFTATRANI